MDCEKCTKNNWKWMKNTKVVLCLIGVYCIFKVGITNYIGRYTKGNGGGAKYGCGPARNVTLSICKTH
jgi:hypothetical protein